MIRILSNRYLQNLRELGIFKKFTREAGYALIIYVLSSGIGYLVHIILANWLGASEYGQMTYALVWSQVLAVLASLGIGRCAVRFLPTYLDRLDWQRVLGLIVYSQRLPIIAGAVISSLSSVAILLLPATKLDRFSLILGVWLIPFIALSEVRTQIIRCTQRIALALTPQFLIQPLSLIGIICVIRILYGRFSSSEALGAYIVSYAIPLIVQFIIIRRVMLKGKQEVKPVLESKYWLRVSIPLLFVSLFYILLSRLDALMIGHYLNPKYVGIYIAASKTATVVGFMMIASNAIVAPMVSYYFGRREMQNLQNVVSLASIAVFVPTMIIIIIILPFSKIILELFGADFLQGRSALLILMMGQLVNVTFGPVGVVTNMTGHERESAYVFGFATLCNILFNIYSIPRFGITGAAISTVCSMIIWKISLSALVKSRLGIRCWVFYATRSLFARVEVNDS